MQKTVTSQEFSEGPYTFTYTEDEECGLPKVYAKDGWEIATVHGEDNTQREENAQLFASAPELLELCKDAWHFIVHASAQNGMPMDQADLTGKLAAAIAEAEGKYSVAAFHATALKPMSLKSQGARGTGHPL